MTEHRRPTPDEFRALMRERILVLDGAMGTMIQRYRLDEADFRGERFANHPRDLKGASDVLCLTQPDDHRGDPPRTTSRPAPTSSRPTPSTPTRSRMADYDLADRTSTRSTSPPPRSRAAPPTTSPRTPGQPALRRRLHRADEPHGSRSSPDVNDPGFRDVTFDEMVDAYYEQVARPRRRRRRHPAARDDVRHAEPQGLPVRDREVLRRHRHRACRSWPRSRSSTRRAARSRARRSRRSGTRSRTSPLLSVGINCALGAERDAALRRGAGAASRRSSSAAIRTPACRTRFGGFDETPDDDGRRAAASSPRNGWLNIVGGCCGTTPDHIRAIAEAVERRCRRACRPTVEPHLRLQRPRAADRSAPKRTSSWSASGPTSPARRSSRS